MAFFDPGIPTGFTNIEEWLLLYIYGHPNDDHSTGSLRDQLIEALKDEPSRLDEYNKVQRLFRGPDLTAEEYESQKKPAMSVVQRAVETLIEQGTAKGKRGIDADGAIFFSGLNLTPKGTREAIRSSRAREAKANPTPSFESIIRAIHEGKEKESQDGGEKTEQSK